MMRYIRHAFFAVLALLLLTVALANRGTVTLALLPEQFSGLIGLRISIDLPLFVVILGGIAAGLVIGFVWEWLREHRHRAAAARRSREVARLEREVGRLRKSPEHRDDVLALLEDSGRAP